MTCFYTWAESKLHKTFGLFFFMLLNCSAGGALQVGKGPWGRQHGPGSPSAGSSVALPGTQQDVAC